ncbi:MAG: MerR family transcriptional regulator [Nocardioidaceae bacterium]
MLTISQLAGFVGVTVRAVRHYHARGLLPEPARDFSGYRRYDAQAVIDLIRIKTLTDAGVPLARVSELLQADEDGFARAVEQIDRDLERRIHELACHRQRVRRLAAGDSLVLPADVVDYLARLRAAGMTDRAVRMERDGWVLLMARAPEQVPDWVAQKREALDDEAFVRLYQAFDWAFDWRPDDPRLAALADDVAAYLARLARPADQSATSPGAVADETLVALLDSQSVDASPAWRRLTELVEERRDRAVPATSPTT